MAEINTGGPVHPIEHVTVGLTVRDWFAGMALQGYLAMSAKPDCIAPDDEKLSQWSYDLADAMLRQRAAS